MQSPPIDYLEPEAGFLKSRQMEKNSMLQIPFQMFVYRLAEKEKISSNFRSKQTEATNGVTSNSWDENTSVMEDPITQGSLSPDIKPVYIYQNSKEAEKSDKKLPCDLWSVRSETLDKKIVQKKKTVAFRARKNPVNAKTKTAGKSSAWNPSGNSATGCRKSY